MRSIPRSCSGRANAPETNSAVAILVTDGSKRAVADSIPASCAASQPVPECSQSISARRGTGSAGSAGWSRVSSTDSKIEDFDCTKLVSVLPANSTQRKVEKVSPIEAPRDSDTRRQTGRTAQSV